MQNQSAEVSWGANDTPVSARFDDPYYSLEDGLAETRHVFLDGNRLAERLRDGFHIAELGFGTGLNFLSALHLWQEMDAPGTLHFTSFEAYPMAPDDLARSLARFDALGELRTTLAASWDPAGGVFAPVPGVRLEVIVGDARETLPRWSGRADAWFLDGFSPAKNPELWSAPLMEAVGARTGSGGTCATYTAAGFVRRALADAGFAVQRVPGFGRKRHMTVGSMPA
ncbi:tRNA (5-methylaminomethyl-2-thiouridine)(34)-methyltransferase MnmD [uncultured Roseobacter sp.]|uniref:tRNA (5-methylaminomethyl-2-thiouridine)(34)-methyltransferase MnmD n=1 Tax=uncultured Roseobacter sp. TaxID=114847 RepID=UPI002605BCD3|nr:tRNA (5-methylaminomethyl-2-thiouridine)(34)-methyltransferase MnmD [uncultured Roseobacter sp.]